MSLTPQPIRGMSIDKTNPLARGLVGYWPMVEGTGNVVADYSGHNNHGAMQNMDPATDWVPGTHGNALDFDGTDDYVDFGDVLNPGLGGFSCGGWVKTTDTEWTLIGKTFAGSTTTRWSIIYTSGFLRFRVTYDGTDVSTSWTTTDVIDGDWHHIVGTVARDGAQILFVDRVVRASAPVSSHSSADLSSSYHLFAGRYNDGVDGTNPHPTFAKLNGRLSQLFFYHRDLTVYEIRTLYADPWALFRRKVVIPKEEPPPEPSDVIVVNQRVQPIRGMSIDKTNPLARGLVGYWPMVEGTGNVVADYSGHNNHGAMQNMDPATDWVAGKHGKALDFDGTDDSVQTSFQWSSLTDFSVVAWCKWGAAGWGGLFGGVTSRHQTLFYSDAYNFRVGNVTAVLDADSPVGQDVCVACTKAGTTGEVWINGSSVGSDTVGATPTATDLEIGAIGNNGYYFDGAIAGLAIFSRPISPSEIATLYADPWALFRRTIVIPSEEPPAYDIQGSNAYGSDQISFNWTVNPA